MWWTFLTKNNKIYQSQTLTKASRDSTVYGPITNSLGPNKLGYFLCWLKWSKNGPLKLVLGQSFWNWSNRLCFDDDEVRVLRENFFPFCRTDLRNELVGELEQTSAHEAEVFSGFRFFLDFFETDETKFWLEMAQFASHQTCSLWSKQLIS